MQIVLPRPINTIFTMGSSITNYYASPQRFPQRPRKQLAPDAKVSILVEFPAVCCRMMLRINIFLHQTAHKACRFHHPIRQCCTSAKAAEQTVSLCFAPNPYEEGCFKTNLWNTSKLSRELCQKSLFNALPESCLFAKIIFPPLSPNLRSTFAFTLKISVPSNGH